MKKIFRRLQNKNNGLQFLACRNFNVYDWFGDGFAAGDGDCRQEDKNYDNTIRQRHSEIFETNGQDESEASGREFQELRSYEIDTPITRKE